MPRVPVPAWCRLSALCVVVIVGLFGLETGFAPTTRADDHLASGQNAIVETDLLLRASPSYDATVVMPVGVGTTVYILDGPLAASDGSSWYQVLVSGEQGFVPGAALIADLNSGESGDGGDAGATTDSPVEAAVTGESATVTTALNLRAGASTSNTVLLVMPTGARVTLTGNSANGFVSVTYNGTAGWAYRSYLATGAAVSPPPSQPETPSGTSATTADLNLRSGANLSAAVLVVMPAGATVTVTGAAQNGFTPVTYGGQSGWAYTSYLTSGDSGNQDSSGDTGTARVTEALNLRTGPSTADGILTVMPAGGTVTLTGTSVNGYLSVRYNGAAGWAYGAYLATGAQAPVSDAPANPAPAPDGETGTATTTTALNLRSGPSTSDAVLLVMPSVAAVTLTGNSANGFSSVTYNGTVGWAYATYLTMGGGDPSPAVPAPGGGSIAWPVQGGTWEIIQGYNGGTHQNRSASAQYYYAFDLARVDGNTAGQAVLSPVSGTVRWVHPPSGGIAIDMGNGYVVAMFHATFSGLSGGQRVQQGQVLGTISGPGGNGYASTPHLEIDVWRSSDGGGSRSSTPFTGVNAISGRSFPDVGGWNQHAGTQFAP